MQRLETTSPHHRVETWHVQQQNEASVRVCRSVNCVDQSNTMESTYYPWTLSPLFFRRIFIDFFFFFTPRPPAPSARRGEAGIKGLALSIRVRAEAAFPFWENSPSRENPGDGQRPPRHVPVWLRCYESPVTSPHSLPLQWSFSSDLNRQPGFNIHLVPMLIKGKVHKNIKNTLVL